MSPLDILVVESHPRAGRLAIEALEAAGHRVHRCHGPGRVAFPCRGITEPDGCPLDAGVDVVLVVRRRVAPRPTDLEQGVTCAIRAGVAIVEDGPTVLDPFEHWIDSRVSGDVVAACEAAAERGRKGREV